MIEIMRKQTPAIVFLAVLFGFVLFTLLILLSYFLWDTYNSF